MTTPRGGMLRALPSIASTTFFSGNWRTDATVINCGSGCTLGPTGSVSVFEQSAAAVYPITVPVRSQMFAVTFGFGGGTSGTGPVIEGETLDYASDVAPTPTSSLPEPATGVECPVAAAALWLGNRRKSIAVSQGDKR